MQQDSHDAASTDSTTENASAKDLEHDDALGQLMQPGAETSAAVDPIGGAESALSEAERQLQGAAAEIRRTAKRTDTPDGLSANKLWTLRVVLILNFALMGVMIAMPQGRGPLPGEPGGEESGSEAEVEPVGTSPFVEPLRDPRYVVPRDDLYDESLFAARDGNYERAAELMHRYVKANASLHPSLLQGAYLILARYLHLSGRTEEAIGFEVEAQRMIGASHLPADLWTSAKAAEAKGDASGMRRAYARLLLQKNMLSPTQYEVVAEAYLKLGDSYRVEADEGAEAARVDAQKQLEKLREGDDR